MKFLQKVSVSVPSFDVSISNDIARRDEVSTIMAMIVLLAIISLPIEPSE